MPSLPPWEQNRHDVLHWRCRAKAGMPTGTELKKSGNNTLMWEYRALVQLSLKDKTLKIIYLPQYGLLEDGGMNSTREGAKTRRNIWGVLLLCFIWINRKAGHG